MGCQEELYYDHAWQRHLWCSIRRIIFFSAIVLTTNSPAFSAVAEWGSRNHFAASQLVRLNLRRCSPPINFSPCRLLSYKGLQPFELRIRPRDIRYSRTEISHFILWPTSEEPQFEIYSVDSLLVAHVFVPYLHNLKLFR